MSRYFDPLCVGWNDDPAHFARPTRRELIRVGFLSGVGLSLGRFLALRSAAAQESPQTPTPAADAVIQIFLDGGMSHIDTFDPKPDAAIEIRGELGVVKTATGEHFGGLLKRTAGVADKLSVIRSFTHTEAAHERGQHSMLTGYKPSPAVEYPAMGAVVSHELGPRRDLPCYVCVPSASSPYHGTGYLSSAYGPFSLGADPASQGFTVRDLSSPADVDEPRGARRRSLLDAINSHFRATERSDRLDAMDTFYQRAYSLVSSPAARGAFDINAEPAAVRDAYGRHEIGQRLLMARRLVEAGVRFVTVMHGGWDHHKGIRDAMNGLMPPVDQAFAALIADLEQRGLLARTLVVLSTEFGRTPRLNRDAGRDHWPKVFSIAMAGGGLKGGRIVGRSDPSGSEPADSPIGPADFAATIFTQLGIDPEKELLSPGNRPIELVRQGRVIRALL
ncbi:MAG: hypothetical protein CHACPFDD_00490 [Phycisphaerae bacterium]|nr:hypothetical protein [Phycisphaerae bacterium]